MVANRYSRATMTPAQCRAARGLLDWNQDKLAAAAAVSVVTIRNFENDKTAPQRATVEVIRRALQQSGVKFIDGELPGVRLASAPTWGPDETKALDFAERLLHTAVGIAGAAQVDLTAQWARDPKVVSLAILGRSLSNFDAAMSLIEQGRVLEARVLARCLIENLLCLGNLRERGAEFVQDLVEDERHNRKVLGERALRIGSKYGADPSDADGLKLRGFMNALAKQSPKAKKLNVGKIAAESVIEPMIVDYGRLSLDAVHCSVTALGRHLEGEEADGKRVGLTMTVTPNLPPGELLSTILNLCRTLMGVAIAANEMMGFTKAGQRLNGLADEFERNGWVRVT
jgi:DNA-binding XRE family transcriptional regulator